MGSSGDTEKIIQRLNDELREAQDQANIEKHKCMEIQGKNNNLWCWIHTNPLTVYCAHTCMKLMQLHFVGILEEERKENKQQADESAKQIKLLQGTSVLFVDWKVLFILMKMSTLLIWTLTMVWTGQLGVLKEQTDVSSAARDELQSARDEVKALKRALEAATAERDRDVAAIQANLSTVSKDLDKWRQTANKYEREIDNLQRDLQQQSKQWQKTAEIQGTKWCKYTYYKIRWWYLVKRILYVSDHSSI